MRPLLPLLLLTLPLPLACGDKDPGETGVVSDGGGSDGGVTDGGGGDSGDTAPPPDECDDHAGELICIDDTAISCDEAGDVAHSQTCDEAAVCQDGDGCISCAVDLDDGTTLDATEHALVRLDPDPVGADSWALRAASMRPITLSVDPLLASGEITLQEAAGLDTGAGAGTISLWSVDGEELGASASFDVSELPATVYVQGLVEGEALLQASVAGCDEGLAETTLRVGSWRDLAGRALDGFPWLERVRAFSYGEDVQLSLDPVIHGDLAGRSATIYIVDHKSPDQWAADPALVEVDSTESVTISGLSMTDDSFTAWEGELPTDETVVGEPYDLVLDLDGDGSLSAGDLFEGPGREEPAFYVLGDLSRPGPWLAETIQYSGGAWLGQRTYFPTDIADLVAEEGPRPLVIISHGNGHDYTWYDYLGYHLATWGYVVMAHQNNTGPGIEYCSITTLTNTEYLLANLDSIGEGVLDGMIDSSRITWIGHSRGGEGVTRAYDRLVTGDYPSALSLEHFSADDIALISSIAPTVFLGVDDSNPHDRPYHLIAGGADGDVTGGPSSGVVQYQRILEVSTEDAAMTYVHGASHNDFNCCGPADGTGPDLIGPDAAQILARSVYLSLVEWVVQGNPAPADLLTRPWESFSDAGVPDDITVANTWRPGASADRYVLDDFQTHEDTDESSMGTEVSSTVADLQEGKLNDNDSSFAWTDRDPMNGMTLAHDSDDESRGAVFSWEDEATWRVVMPAEDGPDFRDYTWISLRAAQGTRHPNTASLDDALTFAVTLIDVDGNESSISLADAGIAITDVYPRTGYGAGSGWANEWNTVRLRTADFLTEGTPLDLSAIAAVELRFGGAWGSSPGRLGIDDLMLVND